jgi:antitoxin YobK
MQHIKDGIMEKVNIHREKMGTYYSPMDDSDIKSIEERYGVKLPVSFKWFQKDFLFGGMAANILGKTVHPETKKVAYDIIEYTDDYIKRGLPKGLIVICHVDEFGYCLDTNRTDENGECPVISWTNFDKDGIIDHHKNFFEFLLDEIDNAIDNDFFED